MDEIDLKRRILEEVLDLGKVSDFGILGFLEMISGQFLLVRPIPLADTDNGGYFSLRLDLRQQQSKLN
jgi:hypothetical protein